MSYYKSKMHLPVTEKMSFEIVTLPMHTNLLDAEIDFIIKNVNKFKD